ncbi:hypothetical protein SAY86_003552 [Trapa natans]|uniref:EF-hand domain-containing protein n=1 Tax=Trapa natans TaxID=22666 RepID=A0AAN7RI15_TRANT|nr:hypothetical protein SAY86_003552 [Trapa natans]
MSSSSPRGQEELVFEDFFPVMVKKLGADGFMKELISGFRLLVDGEKGVITFGSLKKSLALLGLGGVLSDDDVTSMLQEGDMNGDGGLSEEEFCVLMLRLSPELMRGSMDLVEEAVVYNKVDGPW